MAGYFKAFNIQRVFNYPVECSNDVLQRSLTYSWNGTKTLWFSWALLDWSKATVFLLIVFHMYLLRNWKTWKHATTRARVLHGYSMIRRSIPVQNKSWFENGWDAWFYNIIDIVTKISIVGCKFISFLDTEWNIQVSFTFISLHEKKCSCFITSRAIASPMLQLLG